MLTYPHIDPVAISLGPLSVRWYGLMYLAGFDVDTGELTQIWPCFLCSKMIVNSGVSKVIMRTGDETYREMDPMDLYQMRSREALGDDTQQGVK